jgi:hypothetical protein
MMEFVVTSGQSGKHRLLVDLNPDKQAERQTER